MPGSEGQVVELDWRWEPGEQSPAVVTQERRCLQDVMCAMQARVSNPAGTLTQIKKTNKKRYL